MKNTKKKQKQKQNIYIYTKINNIYIIYPYYLIIIYFISYLKKKKMSSRPQLHVTVIRHAETNSNLNHILQGQIGM